MLWIPKLKLMGFFCSKCGSPTHFHSWKRRSAWSSDSEETTILQLQVICTNPDCKKTHVIIPDFLCPYKRYVSSEIEVAVAAQNSKEAVNPNTAAEESTIRRWRKQFAMRFKERLNVLERTLLKEYTQMVSLLDNSQGLGRIRNLLQFFPKRPASTLMGRANLELFRSSSGLYF
jgi:hypothetical protein